MRLQRISMALLLSATFAIYAAPKELIIHNMTELESNAFINDSLPSPVPTRAHSINHVPWMMVMMLCAGQSTPEGLCPATIKMATNTMNPITVGNVVLNIKTGEISPSVISGNGFQMTVASNAVGVATIQRI